MHMMNPMMFCHRAYDTGKTYISRGHNSPRKIGLVLLKIEASGTIVKRIRVYGVKLETEYKQGTRKK